MGFDQLESAVLQKSKKDADKIISDAEARKKQILDEAKAEVSEMKKRSEDDLRQLIDMMEKKEIAQSQLEVKKMLLMTRKELIDRAFSEALKKIGRDLGKQESKVLLAKLLKKAEKEIDVGKVYCSKKDTELLKESAPGDMSGGLIAESKDGRTMVDYSFETRLEEIKDRHIAEITKMIFR